MSLGDEPWPVSETIQCPPNDLHALRMGSGDIGLSTETTLGERLWKLGSNPFQLFANFHDCQPCACLSAETSSSTLQKHFTW